MKAEILIIDDNPDIRSIIKDLIGEEGYATRVAANYNQALTEIDKKTGKFRLSRKVLIPKPEK